MSETLPRAWLRTDAGAAAVAMLWAEGTTQIRLARVFGYPKSPEVNKAISEFLERYGERCKWRDDQSNFQKAGDERKALVAAAVQFYRRSLTV